MAAVAGGLGAALIWSIGSVYSSRAARALGPMLTLAWVMLLGLLMVALVLPFAGSASLSAHSVLWLVLGGTGNVGGLLLMYHALRIGQMGVVMPIVCTEGGIAAAIAIAAGQTVGSVQGAALILTVLGVMLTAIARRPSGEAPGAAPQPVVEGLTMAVGPPTGHADGRAAAWASVAAFSFGIGLYATGRAGAVLPTTWAVMPPRVVGVLLVTIPLALAHRLRLPGAYVRPLLVAAACEVGGYFAYVTGAQHGIAIAAVLSTLTGAISAGFGRALFGERLRLTQLVGVFTIFVGVAALSALSA